MCLGVFLLGFILYGTFCAFRTWGNFDYNLFKNLLILFIFLSWDPCSSNVRVFDIVLESLRWSSVLFIFFFTLYCSSEIISTILSSNSLIRSSASGILLWLPSRVFLISVIVLFVSVCLFFNSSLHYGLVSSFSLDSGQPSIFVRSLAS